jgi:hypothetical protein
VADRSRKWDAGSRGKREVRIAFPSWSWGTRFGEDMPGAMSPWQPLTRPAPVQRYPGGGARVGDQVSQRECHCRTNLLISLQIWEACVGFVSRHSSVSSAAYQPAPSTQSHTGRHTPRHMGCLLVNNKLNHLVFFNNLFSNPYFLPLYLGRFLFGRPLIPIISKHPLSEHSICPP